MFKSQVFAYNFSKSTKTKSVAAWGGKKAQSLQPDWKTVSAACVLSGLTHAKTLGRLFRQLALSGNTKQTANKQIQCMMYSQKHRHSRSLTFDLFTFSNSSRPPLASLYKHVFTNSTRAWQQFPKKLPVCCVVLTLKLVLGLTYWWSSIRAEITRPFLKVKHTDTLSVWLYHLVSDNTSCLKHHLEPWTRINMHKTQTLPWNENLSAKFLK